MSVPQPRRIPPRPAYSGDSWFGSGIFRLYLDDVLQIYDVLVAFAPNSPSFREELDQHERGWGWVPSSHRRATDSIASGDPLPPPMPTVSVIINSAYELDSRAQLEAFQPKRIKSIAMRVGHYDLTFESDEWMTRVSRGFNDESTVAAYDEIVGILSARVEWWSKWLTGARVRNVLIVALVILSALNLFRTDRWLAVLLFIDATLLLYLMVFWRKTWGNRERVILVYRENAPSPLRDLAKDVGVSVLKTALLAGLAVVAGMFLGLLRP